MTWKIAQRPGYLGKRRDETIASWDRQYGPNNWQLRWQWGGEIEGFDSLLELPMALALYEDGYYHFLRDNPEILEELVAVASEVYDDDPLNILSGLDYSHQKGNLNHFHDIAIRRSVIRLGRRFEGKQLLHIRHELGNHPLSMVLSPGDVPFHLPHMICQPQAERWWWQPDSVESFYQSNKVLIVRVSKLQENSGA